MSPIILSVCESLKACSKRSGFEGIGIPQGQYSRIENGKVEPTISTLEKFAKVLEVSISELFKSNQLEEQLNLPLMEKIKMMDKLNTHEKEALLKIIDAMISKKILKDNLASLVAH